MKLFSRIRDILSANINDLVEGMEDPEKMLRQAVREMEATIGRAKENVARLMAGRQMITRELEKNREQAKLWAGRAERAVGDGNDQLARKGIARKQEHEKLATALEDELVETQTAIKRLRHQLGAMEAKLAEAKRRLVTLSARKCAADLQSRVSALHAPAPAGSAFAKFDRLRGKVEIAEAQADAMCELACEGGSEADLGFEREGDIEVEAELSELKKRIKS